MKEIKEKLVAYLEMLPVNRSISAVEAERRSGAFLEVCAKLIDWRHLLSEDKIRLTTAQSVTYAEELSKATGKTVTENKVTVEASHSYTTAREDLESIENDIQYLKSMYEVFNNGHIFYRNMSKEYGGG